MSIQRTGELIFTGQHFDGTGRTFGKLTVWLYGHLQGSFLNSAYSTLNSLLAQALRQPKRLFIIY